MDRTHYMKLAFDAYNNKHHDEAYQHAIEGIKLYPDEGDLHFLLGAITATSDRHEEALTHFGKAAQCPEPNEMLTAWLYRTHIALGNNAYLAANWEEAIRQYVYVLNLEPGQEIAIANLPLALDRARRRIKMSDLTMELNEDEIGHHIALFGMMKSGSTYTYQGISAITGYRSRLMPTYITSQNFPELSLESMFINAKKNTMSQMHMRATHMNIYLLQAFNVRVLVQVRNIYDTMVSFLDFMAGNIALDVSWFRKYEDWSEEKKLDAIIAHYTSWYFQFYVSWCYATRTHLTDPAVADGVPKLNAHWIYYDQDFEDKADMLRRVCDYCGVSDAAKKVPLAVASLEKNRQATRFNKGIKGRGERLTKAQREAIRHHTQFYPGVDFSPLGL